MLKTLRRHGFVTHSFDYWVSMKTFGQIKMRLKKRIIQLAERGYYQLIGHSLGGVLIRAALNELSPTVRRPTHVYLLGSPMRASTLAQRLQSNPLFRLLTGDCGAMLGSEKRMQEIARIDIPTTAVIGTKSIALTRRWFTQQPNDGVVSHQETYADWLHQEIQVPLIHSVLPFSQSIAELIVQLVTQTSTPDS